MPRLRPLAPAVGWLAIIIGAALHTGVAVAQPPGPLGGDEDSRRITDIRFSGSRHTSERFLRRMLGLSAGQSYTRDSLDVATARLEATNLFTFVDIQEMSDGAEGTRLQVEVEERQRVRLGADPRYNQRFAFHPEITLRIASLRGVGDTGWVTGGAGKKRVIAAGWTSPWWRGEHRFGTELAARHESYRFMFLPLHEKDTRVGLRATIGERTRLTLSAGPEYRRVKLEPREGATGEAARLRDLTDPAFTLRLEHDGRNRAVYPREGLHARADARFSGLGQGTTYQQFGLHLAAFGHLPGLLSLGARTSWALSGGRVPDYEQIYLGGPETIRGVDNGSLRGDESFLATIEIRRPIIDLHAGDEGGSYGLGVHAFSDWGKAWDRRTGWDRAGSVVHTLGAGAHVNVLTKSFRFEWARRVSTDYFVFGDEFTF